ncbi:unnamed protein product [Owenia fusiformis]|uniref:ornithine carbamoyltransferase n=1 Tax=Owenia fusiformis TaxID=6347 RepID=A0A8J1TBN4_OWEFU|nr:unnamed protein product [Owenia fusiformis]
MLAVKTLVYCGRSISSLMRTNVHSPEIENLLQCLRTTSYIQNRNQSGGVNLRGRDLLTLKQLTAAELQQLLWTAMDLKTRIKDNHEIYQPLLGKSLAMIFQKRSTRTRISNETGMALLGGHPVFLSPQDIHLGVNESIKDSARVLSGMCDGILARVYGHEVVTELAEYSSVPVINGLSDLYHPLQILADFITLQEYFGYLQGLKIAWVGDGNNITHSFLMGCPLMGIELRIATPKGYEVDPAVMHDALKLSAKHGSCISISNDPKEVAYRADVIVTDTWISMGQEEEKEKRLNDFHGYQIDRKLVNEMAAKWVFLHCLPRKSEEVTDDVFYDTKHSLVWQEAENRKWSAMAVILHLLGDHSCKIDKPNFQRE